MRLRIDLTSETNLRASSIGRRLSNAVSEGSANHDFIGMALSEMEKVTSLKEPPILHCKRSSCLPWGRYLGGGGDVVIVRRSPDEKKPG